MDTVTDSADDTPLSPAAIAIFTQVYRQSAPVANGCTLGAWVVASATLGGAGAVLANADYIISAVASDWLSKLIYWVHNKPLIFGRPGLGVTAVAAMQAVTQTASGIKSVCGW